MSNIAKAAPELKAAPSGMKTRAATGQGRTKAKATRTVVTRRQRTHKKEIKDLTSSPESADKAKKSRYSSHTTAKTDNIVEVDWSSLVDEDEGEEEEQAQLSHRERGSKKHHDDTISAPSASILPPEEDEIDLTAEDMDLDQIIRDTCKLPFTICSDEDIESLSTCSKGKQTKTTSPRVHHTPIRLTDLPLSSD